MAAGIVEKIQVQLNLVTGNFIRRLSGAQNQLRRIRKNVTQFGQSMKMPIKDVQAFGDINQQMGTSLGGAGQKLRMMTHGMRGFRMEMLGVMFFGMALMRIFQGLTKTSMEWFGVTETLTPALGLLFMPIGSFMSDVAIKFLEWVSGLTDAQKKWISILVVIVGILGLFLAVVGTLALGIGSMILVFKDWGAAVAMMGIISAVIIGIGLIVSGVILLIQKKFEGIGLIIMGVGAILLLFIGWWALIPIAVGAAVYFIIKNWDKVKAFLKKTFSAIGGWFKKWFWEKPKEWLNKLWDYIKSIFNKIKSLIGGSLIGKAFKLTTKILGSFQTGGIVPQTGPYMLHQGETVIPTGKQGSVDGVSITNHFYGFTMEDLKRELDDRDRRLVNQIERNR